MNKREFLRLSLAGLAALPLMSRSAELFASVDDVRPADLASDEEFWAAIRSTYRLKPDYINLENGYYCLLPEETLERYFEHAREVNYQGSFYMRNFRLEDKDRIAAELAELAGCDADELIVTRNTTESLDTVIAGLDWREEDEAVMARQDYGAMLDMFEQVENRYGIRRRFVDVPMHPVDDEEIVAAYEAAITEKTRLVMVCHMINITGQILPVRKICDMAHARGVEVMVDGAHAFGHFDFSIRDLDCDYYGTSLHKWLSAPLGAGFLYVRRSKIPGLWPMFGESHREATDIRRLNHTGTHPAHTDLAIANAIDYQQTVGIERKELRLRFLQNYWKDRVKDIDGVILNTPAEPHRSCGIGNVGIQGVKPSEMAAALLDEHRIWTVGINGAGGVYGCRITPNLYTSTGDLDALVDALRSMAA